MGNHLFPLLILLVALTSAMALIAEHKLLDANEHLAPGQVKGNRAKTLASKTDIVGVHNVMILIYINLVFLCFRER